MATKSIANSPSEIKSYSCPHCSIVISVSDAGDVFLLYHVEDARNAAWFAEFIRDLRITNGREFEIALDEVKVQCASREAK